MTVAILKQSSFDNIQEVMALKSKARSVVIIMGLLTSPLGEGGGHSSLGDPLPGFKFPFPPVQNVS